MDHETLKVAESGDFKYVPGKWYHALAELKGDEFVIQFVDGQPCTSSMNVWQKRTPAVATGLASQAQKMERLSWTMCRSGRFDHSSSDRGTNSGPVECDESRADR